MTLNCIEERLHILEKMWNEHHNKKVCNIILNSLMDDVVFFCNEKLTEDLEKRIDKLDEEIHGE